MAIKYRVRPIKNRKSGKAFLLLLTSDEHEYLERVSQDRGGHMAVILREHFFTRGWRRKLDDLRQEQGAMPKPLADGEKVS